MSEYFHLRCDSCCAELHAEDFRNGDALVQELIAHAPALLAFERATRGHCEVMLTSRRPVPMGFLQKHEGHALRSVSEYEKRVTRYREE